MQIEEKIERVKKDFLSTTDWEKKYEKIIEYGKNWPGLDEVFKIEDLKDIGKLLNLIYRIIWVP